jgi:phage baseplate assembly protein W
MRPADDKLGRGVAFPPGIGSDGRWAWSSGVENIRQSIRVILRTDRGERIMRPAFGGGLSRFLFQPNTAATHRLIEETITQALGRWERRIRIQSVDVGPDPDEPDAVRATVRYRIIRTDARDSVALRIQLR